MLVLRWHRNKLERCLKSRLYKKPCETTTIIPLHFIAKRQTSFFSFYFELEDRRKTVSHEYQHTVLLLNKAPLFNNFETSMQIANEIIMVSYERNLQGASFRSTVHNSLWEQSEPRTTELHWNTWVSYITRLNQTKRSLMKLFNWNVLA